MFRIVNRLIQWTGKYKRRIYIGFIYAFIHSIFTAIPIMLAAKGLSAVLDDFNGVKPLEGRDIWIMLGAMILAVLGRYLFSYLRVRSGYNRPLVYGNVCHEYGQHCCEWLYHRYRPDIVPCIL